MIIARIRSLFFISSLLLLAGGVGWWFGQRDIAIQWERAIPEVTVVNKAVPASRSNVDFSLFWDVWDRLEREYLDGGAIDSSKMVYGAIAGMTASIGDPYTVFLPPQRQEEAKEELSGKFEGVGIQLGIKNEQISVIAPLDGTPAQKAGVKSGDVIVHVRDEMKKKDIDVGGMALQDVVDIIRGPKGTPITLTLVRDEKPLDLTMKRDAIVVKSIVTEYIDTENSGEKVVYVRLSRFGDETIKEWNVAVKDLIKQTSSGMQVKGMVLDMRNNPGGYLDAAVAISSEFFLDGTVVEQKGKSSSHPFTVEKSGRLASLPLAVLVNGGSASASEIVAGAIQARSRGKLVGEQTFGKGTVQDAQELKGGAGLHITTARWLLPNGNWIHEEGLKPDIEVAYDEEASKDQKYDNQVAKAMETLTNEQVTLNR